MRTIDINCDMGEGGVFDAQIMPLISSCNIACGGHAGNLSTIIKTIELAQKYNVRIGAHPSYPDAKNFGRKAFNISNTQLKKTIKEQIERVNQEIKRRGIQLHHIKPHGALYNELKTSTEQSEIIIESIEEINPNLVLFVPPKSAILNMAKNRLKVQIEGFADRRYNSDLSLTSRSAPNAVLDDKHEVFNQVVNMVVNKTIHSTNGNELHQQFNTICVHSDTPNSLEILEYLNHQLPKKNIKIKG